MPLQKHNKQLEEDHGVDGQGWQYNNYHKCQHQVLIILMEIMSGYHGRGEPGATVKVHVHGVVIRDVGVDRSTETGQHIQEDNQVDEEQKHNNIDFGRPWSGWVGTNVVPIQLGLPTIHDRHIASIVFRGHSIRRKVALVIHTIAGRAEPGASVLVHIPGIIAQWVGTDGNGEWSLPVNRETENLNIEIEVSQAKDGYTQSSRAVYGLKQMHSFTNLIQSPVFRGVR